jgi:hypothetical protein
VLGSAVLGAAIVARDQRHRIGWILLLVGVTSAISLLTEAYGVWVVRQGGPGSRDLGGVSGWLANLLGGQLAIAALAYMFLLAPDGRLLSRRWRWAALTLAAGVLACTVAAASIPPTSFDLSQEADLGPVRALAFGLGFLAIAIGLVASVVSMVVRLHRSRGVERQQVRLVAIAAALVALGVAALFIVQILNGGRQTWASALPLFASYFLLPILLGVAVLRYRLYDVEVIVNRAFVLVAGTAFAALGYTTLVVTTSNLARSQTGGFWLSLLAMAAVALAFQPLRRRVVHLANRLAYGPRAQPYEELSEFSRRISRTPSDSTLLPAVAYAAGRAVSARRATASLVLPGARAVDATWGDAGVQGTESHDVAVRHGDEELGRIRVWIPRGRALRPADERLLHALADQAAVAFRNAALEARLAGNVAALDRTTRELADSRARIIESDDAARRTLEAAISRDVLPHLATMPDDIVAARTAPSVGDAVAGLVARTNRSLEALRDLTRGVFPAQLARAGIEPALRSFLARDGVAAALQVDPSAAGRRFGARVEAAVYHCCTEAARAVPGTSIELSAPGEDLVLRIHGVTRRDVDLQAVTDRIEAAGGSLAPAEGMLTVTIPVATSRPAYALADAAPDG